MVSIASERPTTFPFKSAKVLISGLAIKLYMLTDAPSSVETRQLRELGIRVTGVEK